VKRAIKLDLQVGKSSVHCTSLLNTHFPYYQNVEARSVTKRSQTKRNSAFSSLKIKCNWVNMNIDR